MSTGIYGYFSLSFKEIIITPDVSKTKVKSLDGFSKKAERIKTYLIGQLGKNFNIQDNPLNLTRILECIFPIFEQAQTLIGGRVILLECEDIPALVNIYQREKFVFLQKQELIQLYLLFDVKKN
ncbi:hypothetical protein [Beggiatoa alba]|nr:hypothetical protein [Beggiatoa alba]